MRPIPHPLKYQMKGPSVAALHEALRLLLESRLFLSHDDARRKRFPAALSGRRAWRTYSKLTVELVRLFQEEHGLPLTGEVDEATADAINALLQKAQSEPQAYVVQGTVCYQEAGQPAAGLRIRAYGVDVTRLELLGETHTDARGSYQITFSEKDFRSTLAERGGPNLVLEVLDESGNILGCSKRFPNASHETEIHLQLGKVCVVRGTVVDHGGVPIAGIEVVAFDRDLRREEFLGKAQTDPQGCYTIAYSPTQFLKVGKEQADLVVKVFAADGALLVASPTLFNAPDAAVVDLVIPADKQRPLSLFERIAQALSPLVEGLAIAELEEDHKHQDLSFLVGETGFDVKTLARFALAHRLARKELPAEFWFALLNEAFFQYSAERSLKDQAATVLERLPSWDAFAVHKALTRSFNQWEIPRSFQDEVSRWTESFLKLIADTLAGQRANTFVRSALTHAGIQDPAKCETFARLFHTRKALMSELGAELEKDESFTSDEIADLRTSFQLADLTQADFSVVRVIKDDFGIRRPEQIRVLAKRSEAQWIEWVEQKSRTGQFHLPVELGELSKKVKLPETEIYGRMLERQFREAFPTAAFSGGLERALSNGGVSGLKRAGDLSRFLAEHETFEFLNTPIDEFLDTKVGRETEKLATDEQFRLELKAVQRVFKLAPTFEATDALLADGLHSAQQIYRLGESEFVHRYGNRPGFTPETARQIWRRAAETHSAIVSVLGDLLEFSDGVLPGILKSSHPDLAHFPNWNNLFRTGALCECGHCRSVLSPAAYYADLLMFLRDRRSRKPKPEGGYYSVKDILFARRPDLGWLELNCDNANVTLPYIDIVCEVLEAAVDATGENDLELASFTTMPASAAEARAAVATAFNARGIHLGVDIVLSQVDSVDPNRWVVHAENVTYLLTKKPPSLNFFARVLPNTKVSAAELRAYPQYVNARAYAKLREAKYPFSLPFDLFAEEVRASFQKANLQRWALMRTFRGLSAPNNPTNGEIACEYFGISVDPTARFDERRLILTADAILAGQQAVWGEAGPAWLDKVSNVKTFLQKTSLEYNDLLALLDLRFINPTGDITIQHLDDSCDTAQKVIQNLNVNALDRIHRFLRLWWKLKGWKMWELDLVLRHPRIGNGTLDEAFLVNLFYFDRLRRKLGGETTVEQVCALFGNLNTETHFINLYERRGNSLYHSLFLNRKLIRPLDPAFQLDPRTGDLPAGEAITDHQVVILGALGVRETDLTVLKGLTKASDGTPYITDDLNLRNLSFLWRHAWLSKTLKYRVEEWKIMLKLFNQDLFEFAGPQVAWEFLEKIDHLKAAGFTPDELNWLLAADRSAKAATKEAEAERFLTALRRDLQSIKAEYDPARYDFLNATPPTDADRLATLLTFLLQKLNRDEAAIQFILATLRDEVVVEATVTGLPDGFDFPQTIKDAIRIRFDEPAKTLRFTGLMTADERTTLLNDPLLATVTGIAAYQEAIEDLFARPRRALKFYEPVFTAPLASLPAAVDFKALPEALARKISYDAEQRLLRFAGIMSHDEKSALEALSADAAYRAAVESLFNQPSSIDPHDSRVWLTDADLQFPLRDHLAQNLATAVRKALAYLSRTLSEGAIVQQVSAQLGLTEALTRRLLSSYSVLPGPETLLQHFTGDFAATSGVVDYATLKTTFDGWFWAHRVSAILKKWKITLSELEKIVDLTAGARLLDFGSLPLDSSETIASLDRFLRTSRLLRLRDGLTETGITLLGVLQKLSANAYRTVADFAADVHGLNDDWTASDIEALIASFDLTYPTDYLLAETWERLRRAFSFLESLNAGANTVKTFAAAAMTEAHAKTLKELLRSRFGAEAWLTLSTEIQDVLRERKRDALAAYLLAQPKPADAPSGKWENTNDLYAYYLLDVEMSSCQLTSRLVQASGSVQLFVQRCFMGLEPDVVVQADGPNGDSAWRWWKWMRKYRVWEANRKVFLWPENWIEPELRKDKSSFFQELENELLQNDINQHNVEKAFTSYLEKLQGVAQLEIAGFYQEDDGDDTILHVFGRTPGAEPHLYYYRRYDYRRWTPWEKVELDIQGDYLIPAVVNKRLFLFWPVFTEVPDEAGNDTVLTPKADEPKISLQRASKKLRLQLAMSEYCQSKWTPKKISTDFDESASYNVEITRKHYRFFAVDRSNIDGRFVIKYEGHSVGNDNRPYAYLDGAFEISGCKGIPERTFILDRFAHTIRPEFAATGFPTTFLRWLELPARTDAPENDFTLENVLSVHSSFTPVLMQTPGLFQMTPPWHLSYLDQLFFNGLQASDMSPNLSRFVAIGMWLPFFYNDQQRTFFVLPALQVSGVDGGGFVRNYYPEVKRHFRQQESFSQGEIQARVDSLLSALTLDQRQRLEQFLKQQFGDAAPPLRDHPPSFTDAQLKELAVRLAMRFIHNDLSKIALKWFESRQFHFKNFYHPFVCDFTKLVYNPLKGIPALMSRETQLKNSGFSFEQTYQPTEAVVKLPPQYPALSDCYPIEDVDFTPDGAYASYNWELFFHAPLLIANALSKNQRFEEARDWYHFIFNPLGVESPIPGGSPMSKYWITKPFYETTNPQYVQQRIDNLLRMLADPNTAASTKQELERQVLDWRTHPFDPHRIASYRTVAYQKTVVMKYLDNLIAWGDYLFRQDTMESINEATQLYILAAEILGPRPQKIPPRAKPPVESFNELEKEFDKFSNALLQVENLVPVMPGSEVDGESAPIPTLYFCIPQNDKLLRYWDTVADRLYKIRNCMDIEGVRRQLALFEPPIEPGALVKAIAAGVDISSTLADLSAPLPPYRFNVLLQKANELCNDLKALGGALLAALEKKDAEALGLLRQTQEIRLLGAVKAIREMQIEEARETLEGLKKSKDLAQIRKEYYESREFMNAEETAAVDLSRASIGVHTAAAFLDVAGGALANVPDFNIGASGFGGSPHVVSKVFGGEKLSKSLELAARALYQTSSVLDKSASLSSTIAGYRRRKEEWDLQATLAAKEIEQLDRQIAAAELRIAIAERELENHVLQIENARAVDEFMRSKYTNQELYQWQVGQISEVYFRTYKLAYDLAKRAERCFRFELGLQDSNYIQFGYWDSLKKGLLSGEKLQYDLRRLEAAYLEQNRREFELVKHISLALLDPLALVQLRETGRCFFRLPEEVFDLDYPGHYFRRIKSVSLTIPCIAGPYSTISCTLRLLKNSIRINTVRGANGYPRNVDDQGLPTDDDRFVENNVPVRAIATSGAQNDSGVFELNFRDERYLPFERAGAISEWALELFFDPPSNNPDPNNPDFGKPLRQFDYSTISDVILHMKYTAREDAGTFKHDVIKHLRQYLSEDGTTHSLRMFNLRQEFPTQWHRFLHPSNPADGNVFELEMTPDLFPWRDQGKTLKVNTLWVLARCTDTGDYTVVMTPPLPEPPPTGSNTMTLAKVNLYGGLHFAAKSGLENIIIDPSTSPVKWRMNMTRDGQPVQAEEVKDMFLAVGYEWE